MYEETAVKAVSSFVDYPQNRFWHDYFFLRKCLPVSNLIAWLVFVCIEVWIFFPSDV
jgi:hypothetical protein